MKFSHSYLKVSLILFSLFSMPEIGFSQFGQDKITFSVGGQYLQPTKGINNYQNYGSAIGLEVLDMYELSFIKDNLLILGFSSFNIHNRKKINDEDVIKNSFQLLQGLGYKIKPFFLGAGVGYTLMTTEGQYSIASPFSTFLSLGLDLTRDLRIASKYVSSKEKVYQSMYGYGTTTINYNSFSVGFYYVFGMK